MNRSKNIFLFFTFLAIISWAAVAANYGGDFDVFLDAARKIRLHENIYQAPFLRGLQYFYSPLFAVILIPFSAFPFFLTEFIWLLFSFWCLYRFLALSMNYFIPMNSGKVMIFWIAVVLFSLFRFIRPNITMIQVTFFLMWATLESLNLFESNKKIQGSLLLAFAISVKVLPLIFLPYLLYRNYRKEFLMTTLAMVIFLYLPALVLGMDYNNFLLSEWWKIINPANPEHVLETGLGSHSLSALIPVYLTATNGEMDIKRNLINLDVSTAITVLNSVRVFFIILTLAFLRTLPFQKSKDKTWVYWEISYLFLITPLLFPHQQKYAFVYLLPQLLYITYFYIQVWKTKSMKRHLFSLIVFAFILLFFSPVVGSDIIGRNAFDWLQHFRILTIVTLLLIPISLFCNPNRLGEILAGKDSGRSILV